MVRSIPSNCGFTNLACCKNTTFCCIVFYLCRLS
uniref:Uncharacterized protein n=1 Tax=Rhizophora mucronata TaxID=61149 RepID=A0A2P2PXS8_RHIMU